MTAPDGTGVQFVLNSNGEIARAQAPDGTTIAYSYNSAGNLISARNIGTGL